ncbi:MAG TPA: CDP-alcohol phosphatidyltransferase family protein [Burkholderiales bacterium]|nr:CDP-alcohol phosphatidyltransferase family protein [Burkholderiales bacterium]
MSRRFPTVAEVAAAYRPRLANELKTEWAIAVLYRPVSLMITPLFAAVGATPTAVSLLGLAIALALPFVAAAAGAQAWVTVGVLAIAFCVLDCVDGDLARVTGRSSARGAYLDFVVDLAYRAGFYAAAGVAADAARDASGIAALGGDGGVVAGLACALVAILARACRLYVEGGGHGADRPQSQAGISGGEVATAFLSGLDHLLPVAVLVLGALGRLDWAIAWLVVYSLGDFVQTQAAVWKRLA